MSNFYSLATIYLIAKNKNKEQTTFIQQGKLLVYIKKELKNIYEDMLKMGV